MIKVVRSTPFLVKKKEAWFGDKPQLSGFFNTFYIMPSYDKITFGYKRVPLYTKIIRLDNYDHESLLHSFDKHTICKIKKAIKDGILFEIEPSYDSYIDFYNSFAGGKGLKKIGSEIKEYSDNFLITKAVYNKETLVMHSYLYDFTIKRTLIIHSASLYRDEYDSSKRSLIGRANRFLHYQDMLFFLQKGFVTYDLGGYAYQTKSPERIRINEFKDSFNGQLVREYNYYPAWKYIYDALRGLSKRR